MALFPSAIQISAPKLAILKAQINAFILFQLCLFSQWTFRMCQQVYLLRILTSGTFPLVKMYNPNFWNCFLENVCAIICKNLRSPHILYLFEHIHKILVNAVFFVLLFFAAFCLFFCCILILPESESTQNNLLNCLSIAEIMSFMKNHL